MRTKTLILICIAFVVCGCATRRLPKWEKPLKRAEFQTVRTTAYTHTESDHRKYGRRNACGTELRCGTINSASADWARWPAGTIFRIAQTGETFIVDDYGWMLAGTNTIDLYKPSRSAMNGWGVRRVDIQILHWGDPVESYRILAPRSKYRHVQRMLRQLKSQV